MRKPRNDAGKVPIYFLTFNGTNTIDVSPIPTWWSEFVFCINVGQNLNLSSNMKELPLKNGVQIWTSKTARLFFKGQFQFIRMRAVMISRELNDQMCEGRSWRASEFPEVHRIKDISKTGSGHRFVIRWPPDVLRNSHFFLRDTEVFSGNK